MEVVDKHGLILFWRVPEEGSIPSGIKQAKVVGRSGEETEGGTVLGKVRAEF